MLNKKTEKWGALQAKEEKIEFPLPYEMHITVNTEFVWDRWKRDQYDFEVDDFRDCCTRSTRGVLADRCLPRSGLR